MNAGPPLPVRATVATAAAFASQAISFVCYAVVSIVLARLLSPEDFGLFAIAFAVTSVFDIARDGGMVVPLVQTRTLTSAQLDALFWFNAAIGAGLTLIAWLTAPAVGWLYADARVAPIIAALAIAFLFAGVSTTELALLRRQLRFWRLAVCEVAALAVAAALALVVASRGGRYWALVCLHLSRQILLGLLLVLAAGRLPPPTLQWKAIAPLARFGRTMMAFEVIGYLNTRIDNLIVGWFAGPVALGFYAKAFELLLLPVNQVNLPLGHVVHATLSRLQDDPRRYRLSLQRGLLLGASLGMPLIAFLFGHAALVIGVVLGAQWLPSAPIFRALAPAAFLMTVTAGVGWIFTSLGRAERQLPWAIVTTALTVAAFVVGAQWGALGIAIAFSACRAVLFIPTLIFTCHRSPVSWVDVLRAVARPAAASLIALVVSTRVGPLADGPWALAVVGTVFAITYLTCWMALPGGVPLVRDHVLLGRSLYRSA